MGTSLFSILEESRLMSFDTTSSLYLIIPKRVVGSALAFTTIIKVYRCSLLITELLYHLTSILFTSNLKQSFTNNAFYIPAKKINFPAYECIPYF